MNFMNKLLVHNSKKIKLDKRSKKLRSLIVEGLIKSGRGHFGSAMSLIEILRVLYDHILKFDPKKPLKNDRDIMILSKGHGCLGLYAILSDKGFFGTNELKKVGHLHSTLAGHPENKIPGIEASTGSLGHGLSIAVGSALSYKIKNKKNKVFVILGDGEINEGSNWEAALSAAKHKLDNLHVIIDYNKIQSYGFTSEVLNLEPLKDKWESFNFDVTEVNGHNLKQLKKSFLKTKLSKPRLTICHTIKGKGFSFSENNPNWHHKNFFTYKEIINMREEIK
tara:strand:+ start:1491 stop:2327 length:837 start_codon:yes stop_codon:yes gene_type:complete